MRRLDRRRAVRCATLGWRRQGPGCLRVLFPVWFRVRRVTRTAATAAATIIVASLDMKTTAFLYPHAGYETSGCLRGCLPRLSPTKLINAAAAAAVMTIGTPRHHRRPVYWMIHKVGGVERNGGCHWHFLAYNTPRRNPRFELVLLLPLPLPLLLLLPLLLYMSPTFELLADHSLHFSVCRINELRALHKGARRRLQRV